MNVEINQDFLNRLINLAKNRSRNDTLNENDNDSMYDYCGSNVDDAFNSGFDSGEISLAREVLTALGINWK